MRSLLLDLFDSIRFRVRRGPSRRELESDLLAMRRVITRLEGEVSGLVVDMHFMGQFGRLPKDKPGRHLASVTPIRAEVTQ